MDYTDLDNLIIQFLETPKTFYEVVAYFNEYPQQVVCSRLKMLQQDKELIKIKVLYTKS